jgi:hypothetical protein
MKVTTCPSNPSHVTQNPMRRIGIPVSPLVYVYRHAEQEVSEFESIEDGRNRIE